MDAIECDHIYGFAGFADEDWLVDIKEDLIRYSDKIYRLEIFNFCPICGTKLVED